MKEVACKSSVVNALGGMRRQSSTVQFADVAAAVDHSPPQIAEPEKQTNESDRLACGAQ